MAYINELKEWSIDNIRDLVIGKIATKMEFSVENARIAVEAAYEILEVVSQLSDKQITLIRERVWPG